MYARLKSMSLQTIKGSSMISGQTEFNFVAHMTRVFCRMGAYHDSTFISSLTGLCRVPCSRSVIGIIVVLRSTPTPITAFDRFCDTFRSLSLPHKKKVFPGPFEEALFDDHRHRCTGGNARAVPNNNFRESTDNSNAARATGSGAGGHRGSCGCESLAKAYRGTAEAYWTGDANADSEERCASARIRYVGVLLNINWIGLAIMHLIDLKARSPMILFICILYIVPILRD